MAREFKMHRAGTVRFIIAPLGKQPDRAAGRARLVARDRPVPPSRGEPPRQVEEIGGPEGPEPTRYGDWERNGICYDF